MKKTALIVLADGFEEIEAVTPIDILRRAGVEVMIAGLEKKQVKGSRGVEVSADILLADYKDTPDAVVLPGGPGAEKLARSVAVRKLILRAQKADKLIAAICAAPALVLAESGVLEGKKATCYPGYEDRFGKGTVFVSDRVVTDGQVITSRGPGSSVEFALEIVRCLAGENIARDVSEKILAKA